MKHNLEWYYFMSGVDYVYSVFKYKGLVHDWVYDNKGHKVNVQLGCHWGEHENKDLIPLGAEMMERIKPDDIRVIKFLDENPGIWNDPLWDRIVP